MTVIGLTGGIASGKSTAAKHLASLGASVIDADQLGHRAYEPGTAAQVAVAAAFGADVVGSDGRIDRKVLGGKVFGRPDALKNLTDIVWPEIQRLALLEIDAARARVPDRPIVLEAAVLFEAGWQDDVDEVWVVVVERETAIARAMGRDGAERAAIERRIDSQLSNDERRRRADVVIDNSGDEAGLIEQLNVQWARLAETRS